MNAVVIADAQTAAAAEPPALAARRLNAWLANADPRTILEIACKREYCGDIAIVSSFGTESAVLLHMVAQIDPAAPVLLIDTGYLFTKTLQYRDELAGRLGLTNVQAVTPAKAACARQDADGDLWRRAPEACCAIRRVAPLAHALNGYSAWVTGRKRFQGGLRAYLPVVEASQGRVKFNPLARWRPEEIEAYFARHNLPRHPLEARGFSSVGCWPCTQATGAGPDPRAGRWAGSDKTECGIHLAV